MLKWLKRSFADKEDKTSSKRITGFWFVILTTLVVLAGVWNIAQCKDLPTNYLYFLMIMLTAVLLLFMVITTENIIQVVKAIRNNSSKVHDLSDRT